VAYDQLRKSSEAAADWDKVIELSPPVEQVKFRAARANSRAQAGQVAEAVAEVAELTKSDGCDQVFMDWHADEVRILDV
jgi:hypothetical protein